MVNRSEKYFEQFVKRLYEEIGNVFGERVLRILIEEIGGLRVSIPDFRELERKERNKKIKNKFNGANVKEIAYYFNISESQVRRIVTGKGE